MIACLFYHIFLAAWGIWGRLDRVLFNKIISLLTKFLKFKLYKVCSLTQWTGIRNQQQTARNTGRSNNELLNNTLVKGVSRESLKCWTNENENIA